MKYTVLQPFKLNTPRGLIDLIPEQRVTLSDKLASRLLEQGKIEPALPSNLYDHQINDTRTIQGVQFDDPYHNRYTSIDDSPMFINFCTTHIRTHADGFSYMTVIPLTLESSTGLIRVFEWSTFRVSDQNQMAGLYENDMVRIKTGGRVKE